jgi:hypothetical protein
VVRYLGFGENLLLVELTQNDFTQLSRDNTQMQAVFARDVDTEDIGVPNAHIVHFLKMEFYNI